jgi:hypothetical protein
MESLISRQSTSMGITTTRSRALRGGGVVAGPLCTALARSRPSGVQDSTFVVA